MKGDAQQQGAGTIRQDNGLGGSLEALPGIEPPPGPDRKAVTKMVRSALGPLLDDLQSGARSAIEAQRLREIAIWAGDQSAAETITSELVRLAVIAAKPAPTSPQSSRGLKAA